MWVAMGAYWCVITSCTTWCWGTPCVARAASGDRRVGRRWGGCQRGQAPRESSRGPWVRGDESNASGGPEPMQRWGGDRERQRVEQALGRDGARDADWAADVLVVDEAVDQADAAA